MKLTVQRSALLPAVQSLAPIAANRTTMPILASLKLAAADGELTLTATDTEITAHIRIAGVEPERAGTCLIAAERLSAILRAAADGPCSISATADGVRITMGSSRYDLPVQDVDKFPDPDQAEVGEPIEVTAGALRTALARVAFAAERKPAIQSHQLNAVAFDADVGQLHLVATDSKRLSVSRVPCQQPASVKGLYLLPQKAVKSILGILNDDGELVRLTLRPAFVQVTAERAELHTRLVEGKFFPWRKMLPAKFVNPLSIEPAAFLAAVRQAALTTDDTSHRVDFTFEEGRVVMVAKGTGESEVIHPLPGCEREISFPANPDFITEYLAALLSERDRAAAVELYYKAGDKCVVVRAGTDWHYVFVPLIDN